MSMIPVKVLDEILAVQFAVPRVGEGCSQLIEVLHLPCAR